MLVVALHNSLLQSLSVDQFNRIKTMDNKKCKDPLNGNFFDSCVFQNKDGSCAECNPSHSFTEGADAPYLGWIANDDPELKEKLDAQRRYHSSIFKPKQEAKTAEEIEAEICDQLSYLPSAPSVNGVPLVAFDSVIDIVKKAFTQPKDNGN